MLMSRRKVITLSGGAVICSALPARSTPIKSSEISQAIAAHIEAYSELEAALQGLEDVEIADGDTIGAQAAVDTAMQQESIALCKVISIQPTSKTEMKIKGDHIRSTWWFKAGIEGTLQLEKPHIVALLKGIGCEDI